ncbi:hypothetical protein ACOME3_008222 [Neoechinorhynchus agilis]
MTRELEKSFRHFVLALLFLTLVNNSSDHDDYDEQPIQFVSIEAPEGIEFFELNRYTGADIKSKSVDSDKKETANVPPTTESNAPSTLDGASSDSNESERTSDEAPMLPECDKPGKVFPYFEAASGVGRKHKSCYKFRYCKSYRIKTASNTSTNHIQLIDIECPTNAEWNEGKAECIPISEECRIQRLLSFDPMPSWLQFELQCPPTASLMSRERSKIHRYKYYIALNKSRENQIKRETDYLTPIVLQQGIYRHERFRCDAFFKCEYTPHKGVHLFSKAKLLWCKRGQIFNQDWHYCISRSGIDAGYTQTHPVSDTKSECIYYL